MTLYWGGPTSPTYFTTETPPPPKKKEQISVGAIPLSEGAKYCFWCMKNTVEIAILQDNGKSLQDSKERKKKSKTSFLKMMNINVAKLAGLI